MQTGLEVKHWFYFHLQKLAKHWFLLFFFFFQTGKMEEREWNQTEVAITLSRSKDGKDTQKGDTIQMWDLRTGTVLAVLKTNSSDSNSATLIGNDYLVSSQTHTPVLHVYSWRTVSFQGIGIPLLIPSDTTNLQIFCSRKIDLSLVFSR